MRILACCTGLVATVVWVGGTPASNAAETETVRDMPVSSLLFSHSAKLTRLKPGVMYSASKFSLPVRFRLPDRGWSGAQWKTGRLYPAFAESHGIPDGGGPPHFGWFAIAHAGATSGDPPLGLVTVVTAEAPTPSVAATVKVLRTRGHGAKYEPISNAKVAGFSGLQFDGTIVGPRPDHIGHVFVPFSPATHTAHFYPDEYPVYGDVFRILVLNVHGKTVVVFIENVALSTDKFPTFLEDATNVLKGVRFPT